MSGTERVRVLERFQRLWKTVPSWGSNVVKALRLRPTRSAVQNTNSKGDRTYCIVSSFILDGITLWLIFPFSHIAFGVYLKVQLNLCFWQIHANCRIRRVYFSDRLYSEEELPAEFKLYLPVQGKKWNWLVLETGCNYISVDMFINKT